MHCTTLPKVPSPKVLIISSGRKKKRKEADEGVSRTWLQRIHKAEENALQHLNLHSLRDRSSGRLAPAARGNCPDFPGT